VSLRIIGKLAAACATGEILENSCEPSTFLAYTNSVPTHIFDVRGFAKL
jgi:hypothetical protein